MPFANGWEYLMAPGKENVCQRSAMVLAKKWRRAFVSGFTEVK